MKRKTLVIVLIVLNIQLTMTQVKEENTYYLTSELNFGNYLGIDLNAHYIFKNNYSVTVGFSGNIREPKSQPDDYSSGLNGIFKVTTENPYDHFLNYKINVGRLYNLNKQGMIRAHISIGVGYTIIKEPENWQFIESDALINLAENYTYSYGKYNTVSLIINPKIEFPLTAFLGFTVSPMIQLNTHKTYYGIGIGTMLGKIKNDTPQHAAEKNK